MAVFVDANVVVYANAAADPRLKAACLEILSACEAGRLRGQTSVAVLEEIWHLELRGRPAGLAGTAADTRTLLGPLLPVTDEVVRRALALEAGRLGANDRIHAATCLENGIEVILSTDAAFDGIGDVRRVDPLDAPAVEELLDRTR